MMMMKMMMAVVVVVMVVVVVFCIPTDCHITSTDTPKLVLQGMRTC